MGQRVGRIAVLVGHHEAGILGHQVLGQGNRPVAAEVARGVDHLGPEQGGQLAPFLGHVVGHDQGHPVALPPADHRQGDAGVARGRLEDDRVGLQPVRILEIGDQGPGDPILDRAGRVHHLELGEDPDSRIGRHPGNLHERRVADRVEDAVVAAAVRAQCVMGVLVLVTLGLVRGGFAQRDHGLDAPPNPSLVEPPAEPPAIAGRRRTSSAAATTVDSPPR